MTSFCNVSRQGRTQKGALGLQPIPKSDEICVLYLIFVTISPITMLNPFPASETKSWVSRCIIRPYTAHSQYGKSCHPNAQLGSPAYSLDFDYLIFLISLQPFQFSIDAELRTCLDIFLAIRSARSDAVRIFFRV